MGFSVKNVKVECDLQKKGKNAFTTKSDVGLPEGAQLKLAHKLADNSAGIGFEHKNFELKYNTGTQDLTAQLTLDIKQGKNSQLKIAQTVYNHAWERVPSPEIEFETQLFDGELKDALELKHDFDKRVSTIEDEFTWKKHQLNVHVDSATKMDGASVEYKLRAGKKMLNKVGASYSKTDGCVLKYEATPASWSEVETKYNLKTDLLQLGLKYTGIDHVLLEVNADMVGSKITAKPKVKAGIKYTF